MLSFVNYLKRGLDRVQRMIAQRRKASRLRSLPERVVSLEGNPAPPELVACLSVHYDVESVSDVQKQVGESIDVAKQRPCVVWLLKHVHVQPSSGIVGVEGDRVIEALMRGAQRLRWSVGSYDYRQESALHLPDKLCASISTAPLSHYYHWFMDVLPKLYSLQSLSLDEAVTLLMPADLLPFQRTTLDWCLPPNMTVQSVEQNSWVVADRLLMPSYILSRNNGYFPMDYVDFVRSAMFAHVAPASVEIYSRRIYISRSLTSRRNVVNETEVMACLKDQGFEMFHAETMTVEQQIGLFRNAEAVVAPHGAGLTNILFAGRIPVLEFRGQSSVRYYERLAKRLGQAHHYLPAKQGTKGGSMEVDVRQLAKKLAEIGL